jgi:hypothetical protein
VDQRTDRTAGADVPRSGGTRRTDRPAGPSWGHPVPVPDDDLTCTYDRGCSQPAAYGVSLGGERYRPACWEHALFSAVPQARSVTTVELAPLDWAFGDDAPAG